MISFSTCWNSNRHTEGASVINEIIGMGFGSIELSHGLKISLLPDIHDALEKGIIEVSGVHNFYPSPVEIMIDAPDCYEFTSHRAYDRKRALDLTLKTLENAASIGAHYAVIHMGRVPMRKLTPCLEMLQANGLGNSRKYVKTKLKLIRRRQAAAKQ